MIGKLVGPLESRLWLPFKPNADVPAFGVFAITGSEVSNGNVILTAAQYTTGSAAGVVAINGPTDVANGNTGRATLGEGYPTIVLGSGSAGETVGPVASSWSMASGGAGFRVVSSGPIASTILVVRDYAAAIVAFQIDGEYTNATVLDCTLGVWNSSTHNYGYTGAAAKCIDRRQNVPDADDDATGVGHWRPSDTYGRVIEILDLDCPA